MNEHSNSNLSNGDDVVPTDLSPAELLRAFADGEDWAESRLGGDAPEGEAAAQIAFERELRKAVCRCSENESITTPADLRACVERALRAEGDAAPAVVGSIAEAKDTGGQAEMASAHGGVLARIGPFFAVAAVLLLGVALVFNAMNASPGDPQLAWDQARVQSVAGFISREHSNCSSFGDAYERKFAVPESVEAGRAIAAQKLGETPAWFEDAVRRMVGDDAYVFAGVAGCGVPGEGSSVHMIFRPVSGDRVPVSVFIQSDGAAEMEPGACYSCSAAEAQGRPVQFWTEGGFLVYIHAASAQDIDHTRAAFGAPENTVSF